MKALAKNVDLKEMERVLKVSVGHISMLSVAHAFEERQAILDVRSRP